MILVESGLKGNENLRTISSFFYTIFSLTTCDYKNKLNDVTKTDVKMI
jgi:hypothetical protein